MCGILSNSVLLPRIRGSPGKKNTVPRNTVRLATELPVTPGIPRAGLHKTIRAKGCCGSALFREFRPLRAETPAGAFKATPAGKFNLKIFNPDLLPEERTLDDIHQSLVAVLGDLPEHDPAEPLL